jgi:hypothetical protein
MCKNISMRFMIEREKALQFVYQTEMIGIAWITMIMIWVCCVR